MQSSNSRMHFVFFSSDPFEIFYPVICFDAVDMVDFRLAFIVRNKS